MKDNNKIFNRVYDQDYFSGTQAALYIGDVFVDEVVNFTVGVSNTKTPYYGYASQLFDGVSKGPVIVHGSFSINFKEAHYLYLVLMRYHSLEREVRKKLEEALGAKGRVFKPSTQDGEQWYQAEWLGVNYNQDNPLPTPFSDTNRLINRIGIEKIIQNTATKEERFAFFRDMTGFASANGYDTEFESLAEVLEDRVWDTSPADLDRIVRRADDNFFDGFDIYLVYGDYNNEAANQTVRRINGVHLTSSSQSVSVSGEPILEQYNFFARNMY